MNTPSKNPTQNHEHTHTSTTNRTMKKEAKTIDETMTTSRQYHRPEKKANAINKTMKKKPAP